jgi:hypothetical protein
VALPAALVDRDGPLEPGQILGRAIGAALVVLLGDGDWLGGEIRLVGDRGPRRRRVPALEVLLVLVPMAGIPGGRSIGQPLATGPETAIMGPR